MAFQVCQFFLLIALLLPSFDGITKSQATKPSKHGEVHRAKSEIDSLIYKLTLDLKSFNEKETKATAMQKDAAKLARVAKKEIALLRPVQHLLEKLSKGNTSSGYQPCMAWSGGKIPIRIDAVSPLLENFTINVPGKDKDFLPRIYQLDKGIHASIFFPQIEAKTVLLRPTLSEVKPTNVNNKKS